MKTLGNVLKIITALAAIAGIIYVIVTYGDRIVAWARNLVNGCCCKQAVGDAVEEAPSEDIPAEEDAVQAEAKDFEG